MGWHGGSRFWIVAPYVIILSTVLAVYFKDPSTFVIVTTTIMGGAGAKSTVDQYNRGAHPSSFPAAASTHTEDERI
tara:strand:- start:3037 stop:3264 length:228 start_codon:yes stop_codon:yes gene_type:complete